jgi:hypothetical protein
MSEGLQYPALTLVSLLARIFGPSFYDDPRFGWGDPGYGRRFAEFAGNVHASPGQAVMLNPQPLPPGELHALRIADAHIQEIMTLDRMGSLLGGEVMERTMERALSLVAEIDDICPRWPHWPHVWPPPPPPPPWWREEMTATELLLLGSRFLAASQLIEQEKLRSAVGQLGEKALSLSMQR